MKVLTETRVGWALKVGEAESLYAFSGPLRDAWSAFAILPVAVRREQVVSQNTRHSFPRAPTVTLAPIFRVPRANEECAALGTDRAS